MKKVFQYIAIAFCLLTIFFVVQTLLDFAGIKISKNNTKDYRAMLEKAVISDKRTLKNQGWFFQYYDEESAKSYEDKEVFVTSNCPIYAPVIYYSEVPKARLLESNYVQGTYYYTYKINKDEITYEFYWAYDNEQPSALEEIRVTVRINGESMGKQESLQYLQDICNQI